jgi:hypothetical protein
MANGDLITDYIGFGAGAPATPSLGNNSTESAVFLRTSNGHLEAWNGSAWVDTTASAQYGNTIDGELRTLALDGQVGTSGTMRLVGQVVDNAPSSGTYLLNDVVKRENGGWWRCVGGGTPGVWRYEGPAIVRQVTADYQMLDQDDVVIVNDLADSADITVTLPAASGTIKSRTILLINPPSVHTVTLAPHGTDEIVLGSGNIGGSRGMSLPGQAYTLINGGLLDGSQNVWNSVEIGSQSVSLLSGLSWTPEEHTNWDPINDLGTQLQILDARTSITPLIPWSPPSASDWRARAGSTPGAWTLSSGLTVSYQGPNSYALLTNPGDNVVRSASVALPGSLPFEALFKLRLPAGYYGAFQTVWFGLGTSLSGADVSGFSLTGFSTNIMMSNGVLIPHSFTGGAASGAWGWWRVRMDGTTLTLWYSPDGLEYDVLSSVANSTTPTHAVIVFNPTGGSSTATVLLWLDFVAFGHTAPAGQ